MADPSTGPGRGPLERAVRDIGEARRSSHKAPPLSEAAFRALIDERLSHLEVQVSELQRRINGLLFVLVGAVATNLIVGVTT